MCVPVGVQPGPKTIPDGATGYEMGRTPVYTQGAPATYGSSANLPAAMQATLPAQATQAMQTPMRPTLPEVATARNAMAERTAAVDVPGDPRTGPTLPAQASDIARRAVAGEFRGVGRSGERPTLPAQASDTARRAVAGEMKGKGNNNKGGNNPGTSPDGGSESSTTGPRRARTARGSGRARRRSSTASRRYGGGLNIPST